MEKDQPNNINKINNIENTISKDNKSEKSVFKDFKSLITKVDNRVKTKDVTDTKGHLFEDYQLNINLLKGIYEKGFEKPSPVQEEVIPFALMGKDIIARAKNGTGKTGSYVIPILERSDFTNNYVQAVILVPTRELALQVSADIRELGKYLNVQCIICTGGTNIKDDIYRLNNPVQVIVGTPGRIYDLASKNALDLSRCNMLALDEADKLLSQDFQQILENIIDFMPERRQIMLVSATFPINVKSFKEKYLRNAVMKNLMEELTLFGLTQYYTYLKEKLKLHCLHTLFQKVSFKEKLIFLF
jgi:ATP-dependent RNA helicase DDX6/DHH1